MNVSTADLPPMDFWELYNLGFIDKTVDIKNRKIKFKLNIPYQKVKLLTGNNDPEGSSLIDFEKIERHKKRVGAEYLSQLTV